MASYSAEVLADSPVIWPRLHAATAVPVSAATSSSNYPTDGPANAFDGDPATTWTTNGTSTGWLRAQLGSAAVLTDYAITSRQSFAARAPKDWTFEGSNDGSTWTTLDTRSSVTTWASGGETKAYTFSNTTAYSYYRLNVTANNGDTYLCVNELSWTYSLDSSGNGRSLMQPAGTAPSVSTDGPLGGSFSFGSSSGFLRSAYEMMQPAVGTFECWIKFSATPAADLTLLSWSPSNSSNGSCNYVQLLTNGKIRYSIYAGTPINTDSASALTVDTWHHVTCSIGAAGIRVRVDKTNTGSGATTSANSPDLAAFRIHGHWTGAANAAQVGSVLISEPAFYSTQLSTTRTDAHYDAAQPATATLSLTSPTSTATLGATYTDPVTASLSLSAPSSTATVTASYVAPVDASLDLNSPSASSSISAQFDPTPVELTLDLSAPAAELSLAATRRVFIPPNAQEYSDDHFFGRYGMTVGQSVVKTDGHYVTTPYPWLGEIADLTEGRDWFQGGRTYDIDSATAAALLADGFTLTEV